jgi:hypothetical protein
VNRFVAFVKKQRCFLTQFGWGLAIVGVAGFGGTETAKSLFAQPPAGQAGKAAPGGGKAAPPGYTALKFAPEAERAEKKKEKDEMVKGTVPLDPKKIQAYYVGYLFPAMTNTETLEKTNIARAELMLDIEQAEKAGDAVNGPFGDLMVSLCRSLTSGPFHPAASINAVVILNRLNKGKPKGGISEPNDKAKDLLLELSVRGGNDGIQAAALAGLERHAEYGSKAWDDAFRARVANELVASVKAPPPPKRLARPAAWLKGRKLEVLTKFKHPMEAEVYQLALAALAEKTSDSILIEKSLNVDGSYPPLGNMNPELTKKALGNAASFTKSKVLSWQKWVRDSQSFAPLVEAPKKAEPKAKSNPNLNPDADGPSGDADVGGGKAKSKAAPKSNPFADMPPDVKQKRRALHELLENVRFGFSGTRFGNLPASSTTGLAMLVTDAEQTQILRDVLADIKDLQDALNKQTLSDKTILDLETGPIIDKLGKDIDDFLVVLGFEPTPAPEPTVPADGVEPEAASQ